MAKKENMKGLKVVICVSVMGAMLAGGIALANRSEANIFTMPITQMPRRAALNEGGATPGNAFYVMDYTYDTDWDQQWYVGNGYDVWAHFWQQDGETIKGTADVNLGNAITFGHDFDYHARRIVEGQVPEYPSGVTVWNRVLLVRTPHGGGSIDWENAVNETSHITLTDSTSINAIRVNAVDNVGYDKFVSWALRIEKWANARSNELEPEWTNGLCVADGSTSTSDLLTSWSWTAGEYDDIKGDDVKSQFANSSAIGSGSRCEDLAKRYDQIYAKYHTSLGLTDFAGRAS